MDTSHRRRLKREFVRELARYLVDDPALMSLRLQMGGSDAKKWAALRDTTPLFGYTSVVEAEKTLADWLGISMTEETT